MAANWYQIAHSVDCEIQTKISRLLSNKTLKFNCSGFFIVNYKNFYLATLALYFHHFKKRDLSNYPADTIHMAMSTSILNF
jgi:hypothetical protein